MRVKKVDAKRRLIFNKSSANFADFVSLERFVGGRRSKTGGRRKRNSFFANSDGRGRGKGGSWSIGTIPTFQALHVWHCDEKL